ncbi:hypothetical protein [Pedosphaera parvula]|nr:hypothetical protein [Pedosphaera parvula]
MIQLVQHDVHPRQVQRVCNIVKSSNKTWVQSVNFSLPKKLASYDAGARIRDEGKEFSAFLKG